ncbi:DNA gyrase/topoisomerase IV subunit A [Pararcticibacter amylolyticus]|uniref:DNA gyrase/topoisomerase IV subunit A n=1 Tax=Pararcticibacter amylolyticus TaxID=2173175 RepID=A0A2U2P9U3_9SPHI|nr:DNA gyrase/topoisomerase IV subunit A [Pararcticibacter amylolyticus]PWG78115.1 DNA gyrase/topoisomerase IV subunit A [Pararcticibacter amylolyticus]
MSDESLNTNENNEKLQNVTPINGLYENWFLEYASYVILDRAVPHVNDGLKPVQRRILHSLKEMDDGRFNKAANVIGNTMKYHPHGDASIGDAMVQLGQKNLLIDTQGNWGFPTTGDAAAAPRYIEARLSKFANDVVFNPDTTEWQSSYDGRNREPVTLPVKFPLLLAQGAEGIAVGLATKILPHNFIELIDASIEVLKGQRPNLLPDFPTGGMADCSNYNEGQRGGKVRVRARIVERDKKTLAITEIPFSTTTGSLIDSIITANDKGKIKIRKIEDNTAQNVEIIVHLAPGISPDLTIDALYAFTDCEVSISPNTCVIRDDKPHFLSVNDILIENTENTKELLKQELEIRLNELKEKIFFSSLLKIFIQEGMYKNAEYENSGTFDVVLEVLNCLFEPFFPQFYRTILPEDYKKLIDKPMSSITRFDVKKADEQMQVLHDEIKEVTHHLNRLTEYAIAWFEKIKQKYSKDRERKTELRTFDKVEAAQVALANVKFYVNKIDGFVGTGLKKDEFLFECSDIDEIIIFRGDGRFLVTKVQDKVFVGKDILHVGVFKKGDERTVYNMIYKDGESGTSYIKRFSVLGITRDKEYDLTKGTKGSKSLYFSANPNGEAEIVTIQLKPHSKLKKLAFDIDFAEIAIKGRSSMGNIVTKFPVKKILLKSKGISTLAGRKIWFDDILKRLNVDGRGKYLGEFDGADKILTVLANGVYELTSFDLTNHFDDKMLLIEKYNPEKVYTVIHLDGKSKNYHVKRFTFDDIAIGKQMSIINEEPGSKMVLISGAAQPVIKLDVLKGKSLTPETTEVNLADMIDVKGMKAQGNKLSQHEVKSIELIAEHDDEEDVPDPVPETSLKEAVKADKTDIEAEKEIKTEDESDALAKAATEPEKPSSKNVDFEITNPDDVDIDDKGQLGLF